MPALPSSVLEPLWVQVAALLPARQVHHPLGCHRPRIPDRIVFDKPIQVLVFGCGDRRIAVIVLARLVLGGRHVAAASRRLDIAGRSPRATGACRMSRSQGLR